jgi:hypothetical protein
MKALVIIAVVAVGLFLVARSSNFSFYAYSVTTSANGTSQLHCYTGCNTEEVQQAAVENGSDPSPMVRDAIAIVATDQDPAFTRATVAMRRLFNHARRMDHRSGAALFWTGAPKLLPTLDDADSTILGRIRALDLESSASETCREATLRAVTREQGAVRELEISLAQSRPEWSVVSRFYADDVSTVKSFGDELTPCIDAAPQEDQARLAFVMEHF